MSAELNLLPPQRIALLRKRLLMTNGYQLVSTLTMGLLLLTIVGGISIVILHALKSTSSSESNDELTQKISEYNTLRNGIGQQNALLSTMEGLLKKRRVWSDNTHSLLTAIPGGVTMQLMEGKNSEEPSIVFSGQAVTRNTLIILEQRLKALPWILAVDSPNSNLIDRTNAPYEFVVTLK